MAFEFTLNIELTSVDEHFTDYIIFGLQMFVGLMRSPLEEMHCI